MVQYFLMYGLEAGSILVYALLFISLYFEVFMLVAFIEHRRRPTAERRRATGVLPKTCIVVPCYNEERTIGATLRSLLSLAYPKDKLQIIVVDDGSTDHTYSEAMCFANDPRIRVVRKENGGKHSAMNAALALTDAELIGCLDADSEVERGALLEIAPLFADARIAAVTPGIHVRAPKTLLQHMQHVEYRLSIFNRFILAFLGSTFITPGPFSIFRTSVIRKLGGWRYAHSTEDMEMALRIQEAGHLIANAPRAAVHTYTPPHFRALIRQRVRWTYGWLRNAADYRHMIGNRRFGNLSAMILPYSFASIIITLALFFYFLWQSISALSHELTRVQTVGVQPPAFQEYSFFFFNTSAILILVWFSVLLILILISIGSRIGTGSPRLPLSTPLFVAFYSFLAPLWLSAALVRAAFKTGVRWK